MVANKSLGDIHHMFAARAGAGAGGVPDRDGRVVSRHRKPQARLEKHDASSFSTNSFFCRVEIPT